ncbi:SusC/RagA family TonB-linked outer membrane protein [Chondrinema litorale]|uniref:SusC/RagA family TonB-linked outer membrane protein n=1 Tax=Chondrinema litorale TaxID=2994555 RepID=UPI002543F44C|nr:TonB-dependent receptor [Chondrinema litorale]UZR98257.1 TonB-dependent receptor [Chondrinema litorale]
MKKSLIKLLMRASKQLFYVFLAQILCLNLLFAAPTSGQSVKDIYISVTANRVTLLQLFNQIENKTSFTFMYDEKVLGNTESFSIYDDSISVADLLLHIAEKTGLRFKQINENIFVTRKETKVAEPIENFLEITITGKVIDAETGEPLIGASVVVKNTRVGGITDVNGKFSLNIPDNAEALVVSYVGYEAKEVAIGNQTSFEITLATDVSDLDEIVIIGYGDQTKADVTGSVTQITEKEFRQGINTSPDNLLQGKVAGVRVVPTSGEPGAGINVTIRGVGSIRNGSTPLFVVDGVPLSNEDASPTGSDVGFGSSAAKNPLNFLNTSDIESINVLKDASATAIYGARGSNGVVIITTKKGSKGKATLGLDSYVGFSNLSNKLDVLSADEYREALGTNTDYDHGGSTDWQDVIFRNAVTYNNALSFSKQTDSGNYYVSLSNMDQEGIVENSKLERITGRINATETFLDDERLKVDLHLTASETKDFAVPTSDDGGSNGQLIVHTLMANPTQNVFDANGDYTNFNLNAHYNPAYLLDIYEDQTRTLRVLGNIQTSFRIFDGLEYRFNAGLDRSIAERNITIYPNITDLNQTGMYVQNNIESKSSLIEHYLTYNADFGSHDITVLGGFSYQKFENSGTSFSTTNLADKEDGVSPMNNPGFAGTQNGLPSGSAQVNELQSYFGRVNYSFAGKYLLTASMRADGSTRFGENNKYGYFPSFAAGWNISEENFLAGTTSWLDDLKLRGSWGQTGNQEVQNKITQASYSLTGADGYYLYDDLSLVNGLSVSRTPNPDLKWEVSTQFDFGIDFSLWSGKLYGTVDYFSKTTTDAILNVTAETLSPTTNVWINMDGEIVNKGIEFMIGSQLVQTEKFSWSADFNGATLDNEIKNLPVTAIYSGSISGPGQSGVLANIYTNGYAAGSFYLLEHDGYDENGYDVLKDNNGDGAITSDDRVIIEGAIPTFSYGLNTNLNYGAFDLSLSFIGQAGGYLVNNTNLNALNINNLSSDRNVATAYYEDGANSANSPQLSTLYLEKSDFFRLNSARLGYTINTSKVNWLSSANVYVTGQNLFTITKYTGFDPLVNSPKSSGGNQSLGIDYPRYPTARTIILGVSLKI